LPEAIRPLVGEGTAILHVSTYAVTSSMRGAPTTFRVKNLPDPDRAEVRCDGEEHRGWRILDAHVIEVETGIGEHVFRIGSGRALGPGGEARGSAALNGGGGADPGTPR